MRRKYSFDRLPLEERVVLTWSGEFISSIKLESGCVMLYLVDDNYFVEVFYNKDKKKIISIASAVEDRLFLYTEDLDLRELLN